MLESRANQLTQDYTTLKSHNEKERAVQNALQERIKVLEAQLAQRASLDDATALRHGLIQVQQAMDQMALDRERERDEYKEKLQCLQDTVNQEANQIAHDKEKLSRVVEEYRQLQHKLKAFQERTVNAQQLINTNQFSSYEHALRRVNIQLEWLKSASKDALVINFRELKELKALLARGNQEITSAEDDDELEPDFTASYEESVMTAPEQVPVLQEDSEPDTMPLTEELSVESSKEPQKLIEEGERLIALEKENNALECRNKELERERALHSEDAQRMKEKISDVEEKLKQLSFQLARSCSEEEILKNNMAKLQQEKDAFQVRTKELETLCAQQCEDVALSNSKICDLEEELKKLNSELSHSSEEKSLLEINLKNLQDEKKLLEEDFRALQEKYVSQEEQIRYLGVQRTSVETSLFELQKSFTDLEVEKANLKKSLSEEITLLNDQKSQLKHELEEVSGREKEALERLVTQEKAYKLKLETLTKEKEEVESNHKDLEQKLLLEEELKNDMKKKIDEVKNTITNLECQLEEQKKSLRQEVDEKETALEALQAALDEVAGDKLALEAQIETLQTEQKTLLERCYASTAEAEQLRRTHVEACRSQEEVQAALQELGRENQTLQMKMDKLLGRKWAEDSEVTNCLKCEKEFSLIVRKHHCRNCFKIFCNECSSRVTAIEMNKKPVRVCDLCYSELAHK
ncbi:early endosome antigen 1-like isoform X2 [Bacillus rossius redtenbacheri]